MKLARFLLSLARLSDDARAYAETMQLAAESYVSYQRGDYAEAHAKMVASVEATERLAELWGNTEFIVCRRADLEHNLMRVEMRRGAAHAAMRRGVNLLESVSGATRTEPAMDSRVAAVLFDLVMGTIAELVAPLTRHDARSLLSSLSWVHALPTAPSTRAVEWLAVKSTALDDDPEAILRGGAAVSSSGSRQDAGVLVCRHVRRRANVRRARSRCRAGCVRGNPH